MNQNRRDSIAQMLVEKPTVTNAEIMDAFGVSIETVRRDLAYLEKQGVLERVYGGATRKRFMNAEPEYLLRESNCAKEKKAIALAAQRFIVKNSAVYFDIGTTVLMAAGCVDPAAGITAFTSSLRIAAALSERGTDVFLTGGMLRGGELSLSGGTAARNMEDFNIDVMLVGAGGITGDGITDFVPEEAELRRRVLKRAGRVIALADHSKFGVRAMCSVCSAREIDLLITDRGAPASVLKELESAGVEILIAN